MGEWSLPAAVVSCGQGVTATEDRTPTPAGLWPSWAPGDQTGQPARTQPRRRTPRRPRRTARRPVGPRAQSDQPPSCRRPVAPAEVEGAGWAARTRTGIGRALSRLRLGGAAAPVPPSVRRRRGGGRRRGRGRGGRGAGVRGGVTGGGGVAGDVDADFQLGFAPWPRRRRRRRVRAMERRDDVAGQRASGPSGPSRARRRSGRCLGARPRALLQGCRAEASLSAAPAGP